MPLPIVRVLLVVLALVSPALAQDGPRDMAAAQQAARAFQVYVDGVAKQGGRPDLKQPEIAAQFDRIFDLDALNALPPPQASDLGWLLDWVQAANTTVKLFTRYGSKPGSGPDLAALERNMADYEDQFAAAMNFMIRIQARGAVASNLFWAGLKPQERTRVREEGFTGARKSSAEWILETVCSTMPSNAKPANVRLVAAAMRDTREIWAGFFLPQDRSRLIEGLAGYQRQVQDETARADLAAFAAALEAVN